MGVDALSGAKWAYKMQDTLCAKKKNSPNNRPGHLLNQGFCIENQVRDGTPIEKVFDMLELALQGVTQPFSLRSEFDLKNPVVATAKVNPLQPVIKPVADFKTLLPSQFGHCEQPTDFIDATIGGIFPDRDGPASIQILLPKCQ